MVVVQVLELTARVRGTSDFDYTALKERFVSGVVITDEFAAPGAEKRSSMMSAASLGEVVDHGRYRIELLLP